MGMYCIYVFAKFLWLQGVPGSPCHETAKIVDARVTEYFIIIIIIIIFSGSSLLKPHDV